MEQQVDTFLIKCRPLFVALIAFVSEWVLFNSELSISHSNIFATGLKAVGDCIFFVVFFWLLTPKWRWAIIVPVWIYGIWCVANLVYYRFWGDILSPAAISATGNANSDLLKYAIALLQWPDLSFLVIPAAASIVIVLIPSGGSFSLKEKMVGFIMTLVLVVLGHLSYLVTQVRYYRHDFDEGTEKAISEYYLAEEPSRLNFYHRGLLFYFFRALYDTYNVLWPNIELTAEEQQEISEYLRAYSQRQVAQGKVDSLNVVYIIVESLNADVLNKHINGLTVAPTLDSLSALDGTVTFDNVVSQVGNSCSSDGHLILLTGLLPPRKYSYCFTYGEKNYFHTLGDVFPHHHKQVLLADNADIWNKYDIITNFRMGEIVKIKDMTGDPSTLGRDGVLFTDAINRTKTMPEPFFVTMMTMSTHLPFIEDGWGMLPQIASDQTLSTYEKNYYNAIHYFDFYLGNFVKELPRNTMIFIVSDHSQNVNKKSVNHDQAALFMAVNTNRTERISRTVGQVNLFPATLELLGVHIPGYGGLAPSALNPCVTGTIGFHDEIHGTLTPSSADSLRTAYRLSDLILRSNALK